VLNCYSEVPGAEQSVQEHFGKGRRQKKEAEAEIRSVLQVIRVGVTWQRIIGYCVCAYPVFVLLEQFYWAEKLVFS
jgi:hypothetical protein